MIFENKGKENTLETLHIALNAAKERGTTLVVASNAGDTLIELIKMQEEFGTNVPMVMVDCFDEIVELGKLLGLNVVTV